MPSVFENADEWNPNSYDKMGSGPHEEGSKDDTEAGEPHEGHLACMNDFADCHATGDYAGMAKALKRFNKM